MALSVAFGNLKHSTLAYQSERRRSTEAHAQHHMVDILLLLKSTPLIAKQTPKADVAQFVSKNKGDIYRVYYILSKETELYMSDKSYRTDVVRQTLHLMHMLGITNVKKFLERLPTDYLTEFCRGITYFQGEEITERPFYHRESSCGPGSLSAVQKFGTKANKAKVYKCYLERKIYDAIFTDILHYQDLPHLSELKTMERYYQDNFNEKRITVVIGYKNQIEPVTLLITTYTGDDVGDKIEEVYKKTANSKLVKCTKRIFKDNDQVAYFSKEQTEDKEEHWVELTLGTLLKNSKSTPKTTVRFKGGKSKN